ncbi:MAG TPA: hypothetical protein VL048_12935 [Xanthobacteraceae bacterium]|nr:hypothetical protein [Xanthobacteraceae bacterium]
MAVVRKQQLELIRYRIDILELKAGTGAGHVDNPAIPQHRPVGETDSGGVHDVAAPVFAMFSTHLS